MMRFEDIDATEGDDIELSFSVVDRQGNAVNVDSATASFAVAKDGSNAAVLTKTQGAGIVLSGSTATVSFNTADFGCAGKFWAQLRITKSGKAMVVAEGEIMNSPRIQ